MFKLGSKQLLVGAGLSLATAFAMGTADAAVRSADIVLDENATLPIVDISANDSLHLRLLNPNPMPVTFNIPELNVSYTVPENSIRALDISNGVIAAANLQPGEQIAYNVTGPNGELIASGMLENETSLAYIYEESTLVVIEDEEPTYITTQQTEGGAAVRGYW